MPIAIAPIDWQFQALIFQGGDQIAALIVDRAPALEMVVVFGHREQTIPRDISSTQHILEERDYILALPGSPE